MKWIKYINENFNQEDYYREIDYDTYHDDLMFTELFTSKEVEFINTLNPSHWVGNDGICNNGKTAFRVTLKPKDTKDTSKMLYYNITKLEDGWFLVSLTFHSGNHFYKCDQIEGLKKLLKDLDII
jgi:hypothetical protein